jgi:DNA-directed RNA polymerase sigma subunit (sigma70/sigma32)
MSVTSNWEKTHKETPTKEKREAGTDVAEHNIVGSYLNALHAFPQLKHPECVALFQAYKEGVVYDKNGDVVSRTPDASKVHKKIVECNLRLVVSIAKQYKGHNIPIGT